MTFRILVKRFLLFDLADATTFRFCYPSIETESSVMGKSITAIVITVMKW